MDNESTESEYFLVKITDNAFHPDLLKACIMAYTGNETVKIIKIDKNKLSEELQNELK